MEYNLILNIITKFYDKAKIDVMIGYHFRFIDDFDEHIPRIADFWNLQLNGDMKNRDNLPYNLLEVHKPLGIKKGEVGRWMKLFEDNLNEFEKRNEISENDKEIFMGKVNHMRSKIDKFFFG